jgi:hypothetical protein
VSTHRYTSVFCHDWHLWLDVVTAQCAAAVAPGSFAVVREGEE